MRALAAALLLALAACSQQAPQPTRRPPSPTANAPAGASTAPTAQAGALTFPADGVLPPVRTIEALCRCKADRQFFSERIPPAIDMPPGFTARCPGAFTSTERFLVEERTADAAPPLPVRTSAVRIEGADGVTIPAWVSRPADDKAYPLVVYVHGGLAEPALTQPGETIASAGFVAITPGYRGTAFPGMRPQEATRMADIAHRDADDVLAATRWALTNERTTGKVALMGSSIGGGIANVLAFRHPDEWDAVVTAAGITDWACVMKIVSYGQSSAWVIGAAFGGTPEEVPEEYLAYSPLYHADQVRAPYYLVHGLQDTTVPAGISQQWAEALRRAGVDVTFRAYIAEPHGLLQEQPYASSAWQDLFDWLHRHIG